MFAQSIFCSLDERMLASRQSVAINMDQWDGMLRSVDHSDDNAIDNGILPVISIPLGQ